MAKPDQPSSLCVGSSQGKETKERGRIACLHVHCLDLYMKLPRDLPDAERVVSEKSVVIKVHQEDMDVNIVKQRGKSKELEN